MEMVKKNVVNILCGVIALVALIAWVWVGTWYTTFGSRSQETRPTWSLRSKPLVATKRTVPVVNTASIGAPTMVLRGISQCQYDRSGEGSHGYAQATLRGRRLRAMVDMNRLAVTICWSRGSLPVPLDNNENYRFRSQYNAIMDYGGKPDPWDRARPDAGPLNLLDQVLNATTAAPPEEVADAAG